MGRTLVLLEVPLSTWSVCSTVRGKGPCQELWRVGLPESCCIMDWRLSPNVVHWCMFEIHALNKLNSSAFFYSLLAHSQWSFYIKSRYGNGAAVTCNRYVETQMQRERESHYFCSSEIYICLETKCISFSEHPSPVLLRYGVHPSSVTGLSCGCCGCFAAFHWWFQPFIKHSLPGHGG